MFVKWLNDTNTTELALVGGKNASLGEMINHLTELNIQVPNGFVVTSVAYDYFLSQNNLDTIINEILTQIDVDNLASLKSGGQKIRELINSSKMPKEIVEMVDEFYTNLSNQFQSENVDVAVRSSGTAEDMPDASFAGQQDTYLNIHGLQNVIEHIKYCFSSLYTDRAICYRKSMGYLTAKLSVCVQKMVRSDLACSGVAFSLDPDTGFPNIVCINASYGLGEMIVGGRIKPDEYIYFKPTNSCIDKRMGDKSEMMVYCEHDGTKVIGVDIQKRKSYCLNDSQINKLGEWVTNIEAYYCKKFARWCPVDVEWAVDGKNGELYIVQARPETIHSRKTVKKTLETYKLLSSSTPIAQGIAVGDKIATGNIKYVSNIDSPEANQFLEGDILVTEYTDPSFEPLMKIASAIITERGGRTSHAAIVSRELGKIAVVGVENGVKLLSNTSTSTVCCHTGDVGYIYPEKLEYSVEKTDISGVTPKELQTNLMCNIGNPECVFKYYDLPVKGVGLARLEFIIANYIRIHPNALLDYNNLTNKELSTQIDKYLIGTPIDYYVNKLAYGIARIGATFYPHPVIVRFSDFKSNEYRDLLGGNLYEPVEENPMLGFRGCSRYYSPQFKKAFGLECQAIKLVREVMGLTNVIVMLPFCRTVKECQLTLETMAEFGLKRGEHDLQVYLMCEIPSNVILAKEFLKYVDGYSIGSNDLTQLTLGLDRDGGQLTTIGNETNEAVTYLIKKAIKTCKKYGKKIGICGQGPSDIPEFLDFLLEEKIDSISLIPDTIWPTYMRLNS
jgi:pyruvate,water dikinase